MDKKFLRNIIINIAIILAAIALFFVLANFLDSRITAIATETSSARAAQFRASKITEILAAYKSDAPRAKYYQDALSQFLPEQEQLLDYPRYLEGIARVRNVGVTFNYQGEPVAATGPVAGYLSFTMEVSGPLSNTIDFLKDVELQGARFMVAIDTADITRMSDIYRISAQGRAFFKHTQSPAAQAQ